MSASFCTPASGEFAARLLADTDCQAFGLVERGYAALAQPGGTVSVALTGLMAIAVAFFGYRLLLGRGIVLADAVSLTVKIGVVLVIAGSWESWQAVAYNGLARAPTQIASEMLVGIGAAPPLESLQQAIDNLTQATVGYRSRAGIASPLVGGPAAAAMTLNLSAVLLTLSTVGLLVAMRVVLAILLAIAPAMAGLILFDSTRGMAQGWLGVMAAAALAPLFVLLVAAVEFAVLGPMIARLLAEQAAENYETASVMPIGLVAIVFAVAMVIAVRSGARIGRGIRLSWARPAPPAQSTAVTERSSVTERQLLLPGPSSSPAVSRALESIARRDAPAAAPQRIASLSGARASSTARDGRDAVGSSGGNIAVTPLRRQSAKMRAPLRRSRAASRRDA
ncbi:MAG: type IV secretion system protein [Sphingomonas sp.]|nr:type IV secretion system protein [Sphingomonas sp.]